MGYHQQGAVVSHAGGCMARLIIHFRTEEFINYSTCKYKPEALYNQHLAVSQQGSGHTEELPLSH